MDVQLGGREMYQPKDDRPDFEQADVRLATYGTLAPGKANHHQLGRLARFPEEPKKA